jgi:hypothetical protein
VGGDQEVRQVVSGDVAGDGGVVAGGAGVFQNSLVGWGEPEELEDDAFHVFVGGAQIVERGVGFRECGETCEVEGVGRVNANGNE